MTPLGASLQQVIATFRSWAYGHMDEITAARYEYDQRGDDDS